MGQAVSDTNIAFGPKFEVDGCLSEGLVATGPLSSGQVA
jgi:hypothetical protein